MKILNQPFNGQLGEILIEKLEEPFTRLTILSAFVKNSGVLRLKPAMQQFKENGGHIEAFVGVDAHGTSYEAVLNLLDICDDLYIIHSENSATTFHSKVYLLSSDEDKWMSIGSNNLTGGGLWTNFESAICLDENEITTECIEEIEELLNRYRDPEYQCSMHIQSQDELDSLLEDDYLRREIRIQIDARTERQDGQNTNNQQRDRHFGNQAGIHLPRLQQAPRGTIVRNRRGNTQTDVQAIMPIVATNDSEYMWFETRSLTGGSRNILDLSKLGTVISGNASGTRYETDNPDYILGGVAFFDVDPESTNIEKAVTVNYNGVDYMNCVIKFPTGELSNGSWRIQLKGHSENGEKIHTVGGVEWLRFKIIVFEKIRTDYYVMSVLEEDNLETLKQQSKFVATNGSAANSKQYGLL